jgi:hypothetical protein
VFGLVNREGGVMKFHLFLVALLAGTAGLSALRAGEQPPPKPNAPGKGQPPREEKVERPLETLEVQVRKMHELQVAVYQGTRALHKAIESAPGKMSRPEHERAARRLIGKVRATIQQADQAIALLEAEGSAVAFTEVFDQVREDMRHLQRRLERCDVGAKTQALEQDIIDTLDEMTKALEKGK